MPIIWTGLTGKPGYTFPGSSSGGGSSFVSILRIVAAVTGFVYDHGVNSYAAAAITGTVQHAIPGLLPTFGKDDGALLADATASDGLVTYPAASGITGTGDLTIAGMAVLTATDRMYLFNQTSSPLPTTQLALDISGLQGGRIIAYAGAGGSVLISEDDMGIGDGRTHLYVLRRSGGFVEVFLDGMLVGSVDGSAQIPLAVTAVETDLAVNGGGIVDELAWWRRALTDTEIASLVAASGVLSSSTGLLSGQWLQRHLADFAFSDADIDAGSSMIDTPNLSSGDAAGVLAEIAAAEDGMIYVNGAGELVSKGRNEFGVSVLTIGDGGGTEIPFVEPPDWSMDIDRVANRIQVAKDGYALVVADDEDSQNDYGIIPLPWSANLLEASQMDEAAAWLLARYKQPLLRVDSLQVRGQGGYWPQLLALKLGDRITVNHRPPGGVLLTAEVLIEHIGYSIMPTADGWDWVFTFQLAPLPPVFILDDPVQGVLDSDYVLAWGETWPRGFLLDDAVQGVLDDGYVLA